MRIVIVGDGKVGYALTEQLYNEGHDITVIDTNASLLERMSGVLDVIVVVGNGASMKVLQEAGVPGADLVIAATSADELNMVCCLVAKKIGAKRTIARIRNPEYDEQLRSLLQDELGLSMVINPEQAAAAEISRLIRYPTALSVEAFARGRVELLALKVENGTPLADLALRDTMRTLGAKILVCAVERLHEVFIPNGDFTLLPGDNIHIAGTPVEIAKLFKKTSRASARARDVMIIGGGYIAVYLAQLLEEMGVSVKIIERNPARCAMLCEALPRAMIIQGDGTEQELLEQENLTGMDAFVALTDMDEENLIASMYAADRGVEKVIAKINRISYPSILARTGIHSIVSPKQLTANQIIRFVRAMRYGGKRTDDNDALTLYKILGGRAEALDFRVLPDTPHLQLKLSQMPLRKNLLIAMIVHQGKAHIPDGQSRFHVHDTVVVIAAGQRLQTLSDIFTR